MKAIILAAGIGSRLQPMTINKPKPLLEIRGKSILENMIERLRSDGFDEIVVVSGYKSELFYPLRDRLNFKHIIYDGYANNNSAASLKYVIDEITKSTAIINGDLFITDSFVKNLKRGVSCIISQKICDNTPSWGYFVDENCKLLHIDTDATSGYGDGIAFFDNEDDLKIIKDTLLQCSNDEYWEYCYLYSLNQINFYVFKQDRIYIEVDNFYDALLNNLLTPEDIALQISDNAEAKRLGGITNTNYKIVFQGKNKVIRIPNTKTSTFVNRTSEATILSLLDSSITPNSVIYGSDIKVTDFLEGYRNLAINDLVDDKEYIFSLIIEKIKQLHSIKYNENLNIKPLKILSEINRYENLASVNLLSRMEHYFITSVAKRLDNRDCVLCHRDLQLPNIMFNGNDIMLIDFEYAGFTSIVWEIGNFSAELNLNKLEIECFLDLYNNALDDKLDYRDVKEGELVSNYLWALWSWGSNHIVLGREYLIRLHDNLKELMD